MRYTWGSALLQLARNKLLHGLFGVEGENHLLQVQGESCPRRSELGCPPGALLLLLFSLLRAESTRVKAQLHAGHRQVKVIHPATKKLVPKPPALFVRKREMVEAGKHLTSITQHLQILQC